MAEVDKRIFRFPGWLSGFRLIPPQKRGFPWNSFRRWLSGFAVRPFQPGFSVPEMFGELTLDRLILSDNIVSMRTITSRDLSRKPSVISNIKPGESVHVPDRKGGLVMTRAKSQISATEIFSELDALATQCPAMDTKAFLEEGE